MKKLLFSMMIIGLLSCINRYNIKESLDKDGTAVLNAKEFKAKQIKDEIFIFKTSDARLTSAMDDDREL